MPSFPLPGMRRLSALLTLALLSAMLAGCGYNELQSKDEASKAAWGEVVNQYQRRADLIPNLVNTVKGYATHGRVTLEAVTRARAAAASIQAPPEVLNNPAAFQKFQQVQGELSSALSRLMAVSEKYPDLKADTSFRDLQSQLRRSSAKMTIAAAWWPASAPSPPCSTRKRFQPRRRTRQRRLTSPPAALSACAS